MSAVRRVNSYMLFSRVPKPLPFGRTRGFHISARKAMPPKKRIVLCSDGTWKSANNGTRSIPSNVAKLSRAIESWDGNVPQVVYYDTGIGTNLTSDINSSKALKGVVDLFRGFEGATGASLSENVCSAYNFVVNNWTEGDELYIFGFSRGAYTARAIAGLLAEVGVCTNAAMDQFWEMYAAYKSKRPWEDIRDTEWGRSTEVTSTVEESNGQYYLQQGKGKQWLDHCKEVHIEVVGVFDTVGALGLPENIAMNVFDSNFEHGFHNTDIHPHIKNAFQALAIDEHRRPFTPTLWYRPKENTSTRLIQCWFPGVHINIGGGSDDGLKELTEQVGDLEGMANITFAWMVDRVREYTLLKFNDSTLDEIVARYMDNMGNILQRELLANATKKEGILSSVAAKFRSWVAGDPRTVMPFRGWGVGPISDSFAAQNLSMQRMGGSRARAPGRYLFRETKFDNAPAVQKDTFEYIHPVVAHAWSDPHPAGALYKAKSPDDFLGGALYDFDRVAQDDGRRGFKYVQKEQIPQSEGWIDEAVAEKTTGSEWTSSNYPYWKGPVDIPEFQIPPHGDGFESMERRLITTSPRDQIAITWTGQARLQNLEETDKASYDFHMKTMDDQNRRAIQSLQAWDDANGFV